MNDACDEKRTRAVVCRPNDETREADVEMLLFSTQSGRVIRVAPVHENCTRDDIGKRGFISTDKTLHELNTTWSFHPFRISPRPMSSRARRFSAENKSCFIYSKTSFPSGSRVSSRPFSIRAPITPSRVRLATRPSRVEGSASPQASLSSRARDAPPLVRSKRSTPPGGNPKLRAAERAGREIGRAHV